jgi:hypothetical protein
MPVSSVSMTRKLGIGRVGVDDFGRGLDRAMDHGLGAGLGLPAIGSDENFGCGKGKGAPSFRNFCSVPEAACSSFAAAVCWVKICRLPLSRQPLIGGDDPRHQFVADDVLGVNFTCAMPSTPSSSLPAFRQARGLARSAGRPARGRR